MSLRQYPKRAREAGFTLIEIMIALLIGLIGIVVMMQTFAVSEGFKRTATSGTDAQINGGVGMYMIQRELRMAGYAMNDLMIQGCPSVRVWNNTLAVGIDMPLVPIYINPPLIPAGDANTDTLLVAYGNSASAVAGIPVLTTQTDNNSIPLASNYDSFQTGDVFVAMQPGATPSCVLHEVTAATNPTGNCTLVPNSPTTTNASYYGLSVEFGTSAYQKHSPSGCTAATPKYNKATPITDSTGTAIPKLTYAAGQVYNLGAAAVHVYAVRSGALTMCDWIASDCRSAANFTPVVDDVVSLRAVYGMNLTPAASAAPGDGKTITWNRNDLSTNVYLPSRVLAVTMEITARSALKEKPNASGVCVTTPTANKPDITQTWIYESLAGIDLSTSIPSGAAAADWKCYRYKLFQTVVPVRNAMWRPE
jgi:type IV pilus assembly protein PilW